MIQSAIRSESISLITPVVLSKQRVRCLFTVALALRSRGLVIGSREEKEEKEEKEEEEKNLQIAIRCLWDLFD